MTTSRKYTQSDLNDARVLGYDEGFGDGYDDGYSDGYSEGLDDCQDDEKSIEDAYTNGWNDCYDEHKGFSMTTLIVDGDMLLYRSCIAVEREAIFGDTHVL